MRRALLMMVLVMVGLGQGSTGRAEGPQAAKEMLQALERLNQALGLESLPPPHCLKWGYGHEITVDEVKKCAASGLEGAALPGLGKSYVVAILMAAVGPQTVIALALDAPGWAVLSCDPGRPCPPRKAGPDKMGKRVIDRSERACKQATTLWFPARAGCPSAGTSSAPDGGAPRH